MIKKLLVANRGEIAVRIFHAARELGIRTVAVYSEADAGSNHRHMADESVCIGPGEANQSYLVAEKILDAAKQTGADAIHPGYGFLSERDTFCDACNEAGIVFVGPPASAMRALGAKIESKQLAVRAGVPVTPGFFETGASFEDIKKAVDQIGFPVMLKASAGGGGRGMRAVFDPGELEAQFKMAENEALNAFGDGAMMVEKLIQEPRHLEVQLIADQHGNVACLFERECSLQRRHQKLIEEAGSPIMTDDLWQRMQTAVRALVKASGYYGAGTVEFIYEPKTSEFYFMEVNARLQVEHPVTEMVTDVDLVKEQLRVASGLPLDLPAELMQGVRTELRGHAIEARIVAEDPAAGFLPSIGKIVGWAEPKAPGVRVDTGFALGSEISRFYDSLIAKVIVHAPTRQESIAKLQVALRDFHILGVQTNIAYLLDILAHPSFGKGEFDTGFLGREFGDWEPSAEVPEELGEILAHATATTSAERIENGLPGAWQSIPGFGRN